MISPLKVWSFAAAKPGASNIHAVILTISFFIFFFLRIELLLEILSVLVAAKASSCLGHQVENLPSSKVCRTLVSICSIELADRLVIARLGAPVVGQNPRWQAQEQSGGIFGSTGGAFGEDRLNASCPRETTLSIC